ncbi:MAG: hypothetical protein LBO21_07270 [Synergistaceae bacterium]|nr:hypothetical protein [Synergistaceae bacterium]
MSNLEGYWELDRSRESGGTILADLGGGVTATYNLEVSDGSVDVETMDIGDSTVRAKYSYDFTWVVSDGPYAGETIDYEDTDIEIVGERYDNVIEYGEGGEYHLKITILDENLAYIEEGEYDYDFSYGVTTTTNVHYYLKRAGSAPIPPSPPSDDPPVPIPSNPTHPGITDVTGSEPAFESANMEMQSDGVEVLAGNQQAQMSPQTADSNGWSVLTNLDDTAKIYVESANSDILPDCFVSSGKCAADVTIPVPQSVISSGKPALLPMTYRVTLSESELIDAVGRSQASMVLSNPSAYLSNIFNVLVIQKEIKQGGWEGYFTRLVDGVLDPQEAYRIGILQVDGGQALTLELSYYLLDGPEGSGSRQEAFLHDGYLIVPDGHYDGELRDQIWLSVWEDANASLGITESINGGSSSSSSSKSNDKSGGGGCNSGLSAAVLLASAAIIALVRRKRLR